MATESPMAASLRRVSSHFGPSTRMACWAIFAKLRGLPTRAGVVGVVIQKTPIAEARPRPASARNRKAVRAPAFLAKSLAQARRARCKASAWAF